MDTYICIYRADNLDSCAAAWTANHYYRYRTNSFLLHAVTDNEPWPVVKGQHVILVGQVHKQRDVETLLDTAASVTVISHHASTIEELADFAHPRLKLTLSQDSSSSILAWEFYYPRNPAPKVFHHIEDSELQAFDLSGTREIVAALASYPFELNVWGKLISSWFSVVNPALYEEGTALLRAHNKRLEIALANFTYASFAGFVVPIVNCSPDLSFDLAELLNSTDDFTVTYHDTSTHRVYKLYSNIKGVDVSAIARKFGGHGTERHAEFRALVPDHRALDSLCGTGSQSN